MQKQQQQPTTYQNRSRARMAAFNSRKTAEQGNPDYQGRPDAWAQMAREEDPPAGRRQARRGAKPPGEEKPTEPTKSRITKTESAPKDGEMFEIPDMVALAPRRRYNYLNVDLSGFIPLVEQSYAHIRSLDTRLDRYLPFSVFQHAMTEILWVHLLSQAEYGSQPVAVDVGRLRSLIKADTCLYPTEIYEYIAKLGTFKDMNGMIWRVNINAHMQPKPARRRGNVVHAGGDFGIPTDQNHNVYEAYPCPHTTARRVKAEAAGAAHFTPLEAGLTPPNAQPTLDFLGYKNALSQVPPEARAKLQEITWTAGPLATVVQHSMEVWNMTQNHLSALGEKVRMSTGIPSDVWPGNPALAHYAEGEGIPLSRGPATIYSASAATRCEIGIQTLFALRRRRTEEYPGVCYVDGNRYIEGWFETRNEIFDHSGIFTPVSGEFPEIINSDHFHLSGPEDRIVALSSWIKEKMVIRK